MSTCIDFEALAKLKQTSQFADITVVVPAANNAEFKLHKLILAASSKHFQDILSKDPSLNKLSLPVPTDPESGKGINKEQVYRNLFDSLYTQDSLKSLISKGMSNDNCFSYYSVADSLKVEGLTQTITDYVLTNVMNPSNLGTVLLDSVKLQMPVVSDRCMYHLLEDFGKAINSREESERLIRLPFDSFLKLVKENNMSVDTEDSVFDLIIRYIELRDRSGDETKTPNNGEQPGRFLGKDLSPIKPPTPASRTPKNEVAGDQATPNPPPNESDKPAVDPQPEAALKDPGQTEQPTQPEGKAPKDQPPEDPAGPIENAPNPGEISNSQLGSPRLANEASLFDFSTPADFAKLAEDMMKLYPLSDEQKKQLLLSARYKYITHEKIMKEAKNPVLQPFRDILMEGLSAKLKNFEPNSLNYSINLDPRAEYTDQKMVQSMVGESRSPPQYGPPTRNQNIAKTIGQKMIGRPDNANRSPNNFTREKADGMQNAASGVNNIRRNQSDNQGQELPPGFLNMIQSGNFSGKEGGQQSIPKFNQGKSALGQGDQAMAGVGMAYSQYMNSKQQQIANSQFSSGYQGTDQNPFVEAEKKFRMDQSNKPDYSFSNKWRGNNTREGMGDSGGNFQPYMGRSEQGYMPHTDGTWDSAGYNPEEDEAELNFSYKYDFDENGALYYLGTQGKTADYNNPYSLSLVKVFFSSMGKGSYEDFVGRTLVNCRTLNEPNAFMGIDLGQERYIIPSCYTIKNRDSSKHIMLNWLFEGSIDFKTWFILDKRIHKTDDPAYNRIMEKERQMIERRGATSTWSVDQNYLKMASRSVVMQSKNFQGFRFFRIKQISKNSSGADNLALSGFELYGIAKGNGWRIF